MSSPLDRFADNPFYVLEVHAGCTRAEMERSAQRILAALELEIPGASTYATPVGPRGRDAERVRAASAALRDPESRAHHEPWASLPPRPAPPAKRPLDPEPSALRLFGWKR